MHKHIRITNPSDGLGWTSKQRAKRYVAQGRATWADYGRSIQFVEADHRTCSARRSVDLTIAGYNAAANSDLATIAAMAGVPITCPSVALNFGRRKGASRQTFLATQGF